MECLAQSSSRPSFGTLILNLLQHSLFEFTLSCTIYHYNSNTTLLPIRPPHPPSITGLVFRICGKFYLVGCPLNLWQPTYV